MNVFIDRSSTDFQKNIAELYTQIYTILNEADVPQKVLVLDPMVTLKDETV